MPNDIPVSFIEQYQADVHLKFRQMGSRLMNTTRKGTVQGSTVHWQIFGTVVAQAMPARGERHTFQEPGHDRVSATMEDFVVPTYVRKLDLLKQNISERQAHAAAHTSALGIKTDDALFAIMSAGKEKEAGDAAYGFGYNHAMSIVTGFNNSYVPDDGNRFCALHPNSWAQFLKVPQFANADWVGADNLPFKGGMSAKMWMGVLWMPLPNTPFDDETNVATNYAWHRSVVGHGVNQEPQTNWQWHNDYSHYSCVSDMSFGGAVIEDKGCYSVQSLSPPPDPSAG
ncbi:phage capsid protein [Mangrovicoccus algicola]|uniref:Uncharacterized protein n=1 Tax=Mangrovicoccus algicola TaxID=2771008 RepID=A0A8J6YX06_9RHOB|nr:phage capsid protein [Mangrovicoccus algicola]MBE3637356.1 hypothetical protein [Mangrovicoccus algicola]